MTEKQLNIRLFEQAISRSSEYEICKEVLKLLPSCKYTEPILSLPVEVRNQDCIDTVIELSETNDPTKIVMLCMASDYHPGGGVKKGSIAQEEHLCRHSTLYQTLMKIKTQNVYPITDPFIIPKVTFFSHIDHDKKRVKNLKNNVTCAILMSAAVRKRETGFNEEDIIESRRRIDALLKLCAQRGYKIVILSAYGCGAYRNPPKVIASIFKELLDTCYGRYFERVIFSVIGDNFPVFNELLQ
jgi:uncharacterized protein (TIGR02452 family)